MFKVTVSNAWTRNELWVKVFHCEDAAERYATHLWSEDIHTTWAPV